MKVLVPLLLPVIVVVAAQCGTAHDTVVASKLPAPPVDGDYYDGGTASPARVELGRLLFFDKVLSGNRNITCATCHHPALATTDGVALGFGEGPTGVGPERRAGPTKATGVHQRVPRNTAALFNVGAREFTRLLHDGRVETDPEGYWEGGFVSPARWRLPKGLANVLAVQAMFPVVSPIEMAGQEGENPIADAVARNHLAGPGGAWEQLGERLQGIDEYVELFEGAFPDEVAARADVSYILAANAIAAFEASAFRADRSPFDRYLRGDHDALGPEAARGMSLFYGRAGCSRCHAGKFQTDHDFHAIAMPQIGPGKADGGDTGYWAATGEKAFPEDLGRGRVTLDSEDDFKFRTPSLRNVEVTGPWGHDGAYRTLEEIVRHHADPVTALERYRLQADWLPPLPGVLELSGDGPTPGQDWLGALRLKAFLMRDGWVQGRSSQRARIAGANELAPIPISERDIEDLLAFLASLTDPSVRDLGSVVPTRVPSGLPVDP